MTAPEPQFDIFIIGSGPSGAHAALVAVASGRKVALLDIGYTDTRYAPLVPHQSFSEIRRSDTNQQVYFLGDSPSESLRSQAKGGAHLTPARQHMIRDMETLFPLESSSFEPLQSSGLGGLGISWGANCFALEDFELERIGVPPAELSPHYRAAAQEIGVSGRVDDCLTPMIANLDHTAVQPPLPVDTNAETILKRYQRKKKQHNAAGFYLGQSLLAMISKPNAGQSSAGRNANPQFDMDFWSDLGKSVYRPRYTIEKLRNASNFTYLPGRLATHFEEANGVVNVCCREIASNRLESFTARKVILAAGAINSGKLALASFQDHSARLPILCNRNHWMAGINLAMVGRPARDQRHSLSQLTVLMRSDSADRDYVLAQIYSYRSLLWFRLLKDIPLPPELGLVFLRLIATAFTCVNLHFSDEPSSDRWIQLAEGNILKANCSFSAEEEASLQREERRLLGFLARLGCIPLGVTKPAHGASIHYAGTLPYATDNDRPFTTNAAGLLHGTQNVYVADGSTWRFLPAKGLTLTLMANARRVSAQVVADLSR